MESDVTLIGAKFVPSCATSPLSSSSPVTVPQVVPSDVGPSVILPRPPWPPGGSPGRRLDWASRCRSSQRGPPLGGSDLDRRIGEGELHRGGFDTRSIPRVDEEGHRDVASSAEALRPPVQVADPLPGVGRHRLRVLEERPVSRRREPQPVGGLADVKPKRARSSSRRSAICDMPGG